MVCMQITEGGSCVAVFARTVCRMNGDGPSGRKIAGLNVQY